MNRFIRVLCPFLLACLLLSAPAGAVSYVMTYSFAGTSAMYQANLQATGGVVNTLSPSCFDLNADGTVTVHSLSESFVESMHAQGVAVTPFLSNHWVREPGVACLDNIEAVTETLCRAVLQYNLDGINVDIQNVNEQYRDRYTLFVKTLREKLPEKTITVAVAANPKGWTTGWHGSYDYAALAEYSDYLMIMAYDESYYGSQPGPVAGADFVEGAIQYALRYTTADKLVLGVPFFGRYWREDSAVGGSGIAMRDVESILAQYPEAELTYDDNSQSARVRVTLTDNFKLWGGSWLGPGDYTIWYDNLDSLGYKLELVNRYHLMGLGSWALGQENPDFWQLCRDALDNPVFPDVTGHWAEEEILFSYAQGWMVGDNGYFRPEDSLTRAEMAVLLVRLCNLQDGVPGMHFTDTGDHWAAREIAIARQYDLVQGKGGGAYGPEDPITRQEMAVLLDRILVLAGGVDYYDNPFTDVDMEKNSWSYYPILKLAGNQVFDGYPDGTFRPDRAMTRAEIAATLSRISGYGISVGGGSPDFARFSADGYNERGQSPR